MDTTLSPIHVANHWPFVDRHLSLERWETGRLALETVAQLQNDAGGEYVALGRKRLAETMTPGQAGAIWRALVELEDRGVLARRRGSGRRADSWGFRPELSQWRGIPWRYSGREVERVLCGCISRASCAVAARNPGQSVAFPRVKVEFRIAPQDHLLPPGLSSVDTRGFRATRAANAHGRACDPVDSRGYSAEIEPIRARDNSSRELIVLNWDEEQRVRILKEAGEARTGQPLQVPSRPYRRLTAFARRITDRQAELVAAAIKRREGHLYIPKVFEIMEDLAVEDRVIAMAGRPDGGYESGTFEASH